MEMPQMLLARMFFHGMRKKSFGLEAQVLSLLLINLRHILSDWCFSRMDSSKE